MNVASLLAVGSAFCAGSLAFAILYQQRRSLAHWFFALGLALLAGESLMTWFSAEPESAEQVALFQNWRLVLLSVLLGTWLAFSLSYARGEARSYLHQWRWLMLLGFGLPLSVAATCFGKFIVSIDKPTTGTLPRIGLSTAGVLLESMAFLAAVLIITNLERTFRASVGTMRWRIKFTILGLVVLFAIRAYTSSQAMLFRGMDLSLQTLNSAALLVACVLVFRSLLRTGQFEVEVYPSHSVIHNSITILLAGVYLVIVGALAKIFFGEDTSFEVKAFAILVALVLLTILLLSDRTRLYLKRFVSRHFQRPMYDYRTVWRTFTERTACLVEQSELCTAVVKLVSEIFQALSVTVWLVDERRENLAFAASTSLSEAAASRVKLEPDQVAGIILALGSQSEPVDIDASREAWAVALRRCHPEEFRKGGHRFCVPLVAGGEVLGVLALGDRVSGLPFSLQDLDLLKSVGDQTAAALLNCHLTQRLSRGKQLEAFQAMSAFFVHDLKNTASTLSLMLQNLPLHYQDPRFREDALRGISKTVTHINELIGRLSLLRHELTIQAVSSDLNQLVNENLRTFEPTPGVELVKELLPLPPVRIDPAQIQKVLTNLVLNAREAIGNAGQIRVRTSQRPGWAVLSVSDSGCGMSPEFVRNNLFRPFQTTKRRGIGIGMFHCKMIVEAHRGRIEVQSDVGKGTTFQVLLPLTAQSA